MSLSLIHLMAMRTCVKKTICVYVSEEKQMEKNVAETKLLQIYTNDS